jgi:hypothetical protein
MRQQMILGVGVALVASAVQLGYAQLTVGDLSIQARELRLDYSPQKQ